MCYPKHLPCCWCSRLNGRHQTFIKQLLSLAFLIICSSWCSHSIKHLSKLTEKNFPLLWKLVLGRGLWPKKQLKKMQIIAKQLFYLNTSLRAVCRIWSCWLHVGAADLSISDVYLCHASLLSVYSTYWFLWFFPSWSLLYTLNWATSSAMKHIPESPSAVFLHYWMFWVVGVCQKHE